jgi:hypothetical protein
MAKIIRLQDHLKRSNNTKECKGRGGLAKIISSDKKIAPVLLETWVNQIMDCLQYSREEFKEVVCKYRNDIIEILIYADIFKEHGLYERLSSKAMADIEILRTYKEGFDEYWQEMERKQ